MDPTIEQRQRWTSLLTQIQHEILTWRKVGSELLNRQERIAGVCMKSSIIWTRLTGRISPSWLRSKMGAVKCCVALGCGGENNWENLF